MEELNDYSGKFDQSTTFDSLSKPALVKLIKNYQRIFVGYMGMWNTINKERGMNDEEAWDLDSHVYERQVAQFEVPLVREALNIHGDDVVSMLKYFQMCPDGAREGLYNWDWDVKNNNHAIGTCSYCATLHYYERRGDEKGIELLCWPGNCEDRAFNAIAKCFHPDIKCIPRKLPPRKSEDDICCIWEFKLEK